MTMVELHGAQRALLADKLLDVGNVAAGAMVFGQFLSDRPFSAWLAAMGFVVWGGLLMFGTLLAGRTRA